ncbi:MAG: PQQ-like beta-propeller repeat protein, partial [Candidatus Thorarchaeota archaeon]|nr:PQQ-like beta-propeller repeat protein [Candidatus Thorarchaeota archaeon]
MKTYQAIIALLFVCFLAGVSIQGTGPGSIPVTVLSPESPHTVAEIAPFDTALVWSTTVGMQVNDIVVDNFDSDAYDEVAVIAQNGTLFLFDEDSTLLWQLKLGSTPHAMAAIDGTASAGKEILIGTDAGIIVVGADKFVQMNMSLPEPVYAVTGAHLDADGLEEVVVGCDDFYVYAFEIDTTPLWSYLSNGMVRLLDAADIDSDARTEIVAASEGRRFTLLQDTGIEIFNETSPTAINAIATGGLTDDVYLDVAYGNSNGTVRVFNSTGSFAYELQAVDSITALTVGELLTASFRAELALGTSQGNVRI